MDGNEIKFYLVPTGYPRRISDSFRGICQSGCNGNGPVVFQLPESDEMFFLTHGSFGQYWAYSRFGAEQGQLSNHNILRNIPIRLPDLKAAMLLNGMTYFFAGNGSYWTFSYGDDSQHVWSEQKNLNELLGCS